MEGRAGGLKQIPDPFWTVPTRKSLAGRSWARGMKNDTAVGERK